MDDLDGEASWSRAIQEIFNRLDKAVRSLLCGSRPSCFPIENQHLAQWYHCARCWFLDGEARQSRAIQETSNRHHCAPGAGSRWGSTTVESHTRDFQPPHRGGWKSVGWLSTVVLPHREPAPGAVVPLRQVCLLYTSPSPRDKRQSRMPSSA